MALSGQECRSSGRSRSTDTVTESSQSTGPRSSDTGTSNQSTGQRSSQLTSSAGDSRANPLASQERGRGTRMNGGSGPSSLEPFGKYDLSTHSWRMFLGCSPLTTEGLPEECSGTWPRSGMMRSGVSYRQEMSEPPIGGSESSSWPTPRVRGLLGGSGSQEMLLSLVESGELTEKEFLMITQRQTWPTPRAGMVRIFPTPNARDSSRNASPKRDRLPDIVASSNSGLLNPMWVEWLMGFPLGWTDLSALETQSSPKSQNTSANSLSKRKRAKVVR